jgi:hypothetical protein
MEMALNEQRNDKLPPIGMDRLFFTGITGYEAGVWLVARIAKGFQFDRIAKISIRLFVRRV